MSEKNCANCRFGYKAIEYYSHGDMKWCCMLETGGMKKRYALGNASFAPRSCIRWKGEERTCRALPLTTVGMATEHIVVQHLATGDVSRACPYRRCSECDANFPDGSNYCPGCGAKVVGE